MTFLNRTADSTASADRGDGASPAERGRVDVGVRDPDAPGNGGLVSRWGYELAVAAASFVLYAWGLSKNGYGNGYYAGSVRAMDSSFTNFVFASYDKGGWITVDKPPMSQWMGAASARLFGFSSWSLLLPSVCCGVAAVWILMATVRRPWGRAAGLTAGMALALTPMMLAVSRSNNPDVLLVLWCVAAAWAVQRGIGDGRPRWMVLAGLFAGFGFLTKSLAVGVVLPGLWLAYLVAAPGAFWRKRVWHCLAGGLVFVAVGALWIGMVDLTPLSSRPWIGGSKDGSAQDLVFGYNGISRVNGSGGGQAPPGFGGAFGTAGGIDEFGGRPGVGRLFNAGMGDQAMWLAPIAIVAAFSALVLTLRRRRRRVERLGSVVMWLVFGAGTWWLFSFAKGTFHNYYVALLSPAIAALVGIGLQLARESGRLLRLVAAATLAATAVLELVFLRRVDAWRALRVVVPAGVAVVVIAVLLTFVWRVRDRQIACVALAAGLVFVLLAPAAWAVSGVEHPQEGVFPNARPKVGNGAGVGGFLNGAGLPERELVWLRAQHKHEKWIVGVGGVPAAESAVANGDAIVALGGFVGTDRSDTPDRVAAAVARSDLRFLVVGSGFLGGGGGSDAAVAKACKLVPSSTWAGASPSGASGGGVGVLYDCRGKADAIRANRAATTTRGTGGQPGGLPGAGGILGGPGGLGLPPGLKIPTNITPAQMQFGMCVLQHGGDLQELIGLATGKAPSADMKKAIDACGGLPPGPPPGGSTPGVSPTNP